MLAIQATVPAILSDSNEDWSEPRVDKGFTVLMLDGDLRPLLE